MQRLRRDVSELERRLGLSGPGVSATMRLVPLVVFAGTVLLVVVIGLSSGVSAAVYLPLGLVFGLVFAGIPIAYIAGAHDDDDEDDG